MVVARVVEGTGEQLELAALLGSVLDLLLLAPPWGNSMGACRAAELIVPEKMFGFDFRMFLQVFESE